MVDQRNSDLGLVQQQILYGMFQKHFKALAPYIYKIIRASVDALCSRDETGQISRDLRKNCLKIRRECVTRPLKLTKSHSRASIQLSTCRKASYVVPVLCARIRSHAISRIRVIIIIFFLFFFSKPKCQCWNELTG